MKAAWMSVFFAIVLFALQGLVSAEEPPNPYFQSGPMMEDYIRFQFAVYLPPDSTGNPTEIVRKLVRDKFQRFRLVDTFEKSMDSIVEPVFIDDVEKDYSVSGPDYIDLFGRGLSRERKQSLLSSKNAMILNFGYHKSHVWDGYKDALELALQLAKETDGILWDEDTREFFSTDAWQTRRLDGWHEGRPNIPNQVTIHAYRIQSGVRAITLGMAKFGLPDVVIEKLPKAYPEAGMLINLFCQLAAEDRWVGEYGAFRVDVESVRHRDFKSQIKKDMAGEAKGAAELVVRQGTHDEGDPNNRLIEITFENGKGDTTSERQVSTLIQIFGVDDDVTSVKHNEEILAASHRAKDKLPALRAEFNNGLKPGESISVKAPFKTSDDGNEWMWVLVTAWKDGSITGVLLNVPADVPGLMKGAEVTVNPADIFDYYFEKSDGTAEGNETGALIQKYAEQ